MLCVECVERGAEGCPKRLERKEHVSFLQPGERGQGHGRASTSIGLSHWDWMPDAAVYYDENSGPGFNLGSMVVFTDRPARLGLGDRLMKNDRGEILEAAVALKQYVIRLKKAIRDLEKSVGSRSGDHEDLACEAELANISVELMLNDFTDLFSEVDAVMDDVLDTRKEYESLIETMNQNKIKNGFIVTQPVSKTK